MAQAAQWALSEHIWDIKSKNSIQKPLYGGLLLILLANRFPLQLIPGLPMGWNYNYNGLSLSNLLVMLQ